MKPIGIASVLAASLLAALASAQSQRRRPPAAPDYPYELTAYDALWGHLLEGNFSEPGGVHFDPEAGELYVADMKNALIGIYDAEGVPLFAFGGSAVFADPRIVQASADGTIYVLDADSSGVKAFNYRGEPLDPVLFPTPDDEPPLERIGTFARDRAGGWYVADLDRPRVLVYDADLNLRFLLPRPDDVGKLELVSGIAVSTDGLIALVDYRATPVQIFNREGRFVSGFGDRDIGVENFTAPVAAAFDQEGYLYVVDMLRHDVKVFNVQGTFQTVFGGWFSPETRGRAPGEMLYPNGIAIDPDGLIYVSERFGNRVQLFERRRKGEKPEPPEPGERVRGER